MGKMEEAIKAEIGRLARKELRAVCGPLGKDVRELKRAVRELSRAAGALKREVEGLRKRVPTEGARLAAPDEEVKAARMSPRLVAALRKRLGLTQTQLAAIVGVSGSAVTFWERGRSRPQGKNFATLVALRQLGRRDVKKLLAEKASEAPPKPKPRKKAKKRRAKKK